MKRNVIIFLVIIGLSQGCKTTKNSLNEKFNYNSFIVYDDPYFDKIKDYERNIKSPFWLKDKIKSLHIIETNSENKRQSSIKYIYDSDKNIIALTNYNSDLKEVMNRNYYLCGNYDGESIIKNGYSILSPNKRKEFKSQLDSVNKVVVVETFENDELESIDSIFYQDNYLPILIKKYGPSKNLQYTKLIEYMDDKISLNLTLRTSGVSSGSKRFYDDQTKHISVNPISNIDAKTMEYKVDSVKTELTEWAGDNFNHFVSPNDVYIYNSNSKTLSRETQNYNYTVNLNNNLNPTQIQYTNKENNESKTITLKYNSNEDVVSKLYSNKQVYDEEEFYEYEYDDHQNWTQRKMFINKKLFNVVERKIEYFK